MPTLSLGTGGGSGGLRWHFRDAAVGTVVPLEPQLTGGCGHGQEFDSMLLITTSAQTMSCDLMFLLPGGKGLLRHC